jgi:FemAB-related protein (PEP-CTERM system-associated)
MSDKESVDTSMIVSVSELTSDEERAWDDFVRHSPSGTFFHLSAWKRVIERAFGHRTYYLLAKRGRRVCGVLPLTHIKSLLFGNSLISNAFCVYGGPVADSEEVRLALSARALEIAHDLAVECLEFRPLRLDQTDRQPGRGLYATFRRAILGDAEANMKAIPRKQRAVVRKGIANGLRADLDDNVDRLHDVYAHSVRNLGTPVFPKRYFQILREEFQELCDVLTVVNSGKPVASVLNFYFRDEVLPYYGGGLTEARALAGNDFMYWEVMRRASERGYRLFDFGRSKYGTGSFDFKRNWGFEPTPLDYEFHPVTSCKIRDVNPLNPKYRLAIEMWRHLPVPLTKLVGPAIVRSIG